MYCSVELVGLMAAKLVGALKSLDLATVGRTWVCVLYAGGVCVVMYVLWCMCCDVCVVVCVDVCGSGVVFVDVCACMASCNE